MPDDQSWPDALDALTAAPRHHSLLLENEQVRVLDTCIAPGATTPLHAYRWPAVLYVLSWSDFVRRDAAGKVLVDSRGIRGPEPGSAVWSGPLPPHTLENVGSFNLHVIAIEQKSTF